MDRRRAIELDVAVRALNRVPELGRPISVRIGGIQTKSGLFARHADPCNTALPRTNIGTVPRRAPGAHRGSGFGPTA
jgi:hypothetical protein